MSVQASDIVCYGAASMPQDDASGAGGAIDTTTIVVPSSASLFNAFGGSFVDYVSANNGDTMNVTVTGRDSQGRIISETKALNGTTLVPGAVAFSVILKVVLASAAAGVVTLTKHTGGATLTTFPVGVTTVRRLFYAAYANAAGGASIVRYEKFFVKNTNGS